MLPESLTITLVEEQSFEAALEQLHLRFPRSSGTDFLLVPIAIWQTGSPNILRSLAKGNDAQDLVNYIKTHPLVIQPPLKGFLSLVVVGLIEFCADRDLEELYEYPSLESAWKSSSQLFNATISYAEVFGLVSDLKFLFGPCSEWKDLRTFWEWKMLWRDLAAQQMPSDSPTCGQSSGWFVEKQTHHFSWWAILSSFMKCYRG